MKEKVKVYNLYDVEEGTTKLLTGTIEDLRTFMKNRWAECGDFVKDMLGFEIEEDYYAYLDNDTNLCLAMSELGYVADEICEVPIEDFMD